MGTPKGTKPWNAGKGRGWVSRSGYRVISITENGRRKQVREHRHVMERHLGRPLEPWEIVHHKDGNPLNNRPSNRQILSRTANRKKGG